MAVYLSALVPTSKLLAWFALENDGNGVPEIADESGNGHTLTQIGAIPYAIIENQASIKNRPAVVFDESTDKVLQSANGSLSPKDIFIIAKVDHTTNFGAEYRGLLTGADAMANTAILVGEPSDTTWFDASLSLNYWKSGTQYGAADMQAPFAYFEQMQIRNASGIFFDLLQFGQDREDTARVIAAKFCDAQFYSSLLSEQEIAALKLYGDLKFGLYSLNGTNLQFPSPSVTGWGWNYFNAEPTNFANITNSHIYDDESASFNETTDTPVRRWEVRFTGLTYEQLEVFRAFWEEVHLKNTFDFTDKFGATHSGVRIESYSDSHEEHKSWNNFVSIRLVKFP